MTGTRLGSWFLHDEVGRGPLGIVYKATAADGSTMAAVKVLTHPNAHEAGFQQRFPAEMLALQRLNHPNVAKYYESGVQAGTCYTATEWVEGSDAATLVKTRTKKADEPGMNWKDEVIAVAVQVARALKHAHHRSILHRSLKPGNIRVTPTGTVKVTDFGLAKIFNLAPMNLPADPWGSAGFLAPEHFTGKPYTRRSDLYAFGAVLYALLAGRPPHQANTIAEVMHKHCYVLPDRPAQFVPRIPTEFDELICELMAKDPARRPASASTVIDVLDQLRAKIERRGDKVPWPADPGDTALHTPLTADGTLATMKDDTPRPKNLLSRPAVVIPLFVLVLSIIVFSIARPGPSAADLYTKAEPLMKSDNPADWDTAWADYLEPLARKYPDQHEDVIKAFRDKMNSHRELRRIVDAGSKINSTSEGERLYRLGLAYVQAGETALGRKTWEGLITAFSPGQLETKWVALAQAGLVELAKTRTNVAGVDRLAAITTALETVQTLKADKKAALAAEVLAALEDLYKDDPKALALIRKARE